MAEYYDAFYDEKTRTLCIIMDFAEKGDLASEIKTHKDRKSLMNEDKIWE